MTALSITHTSQERRLYTTPMFHVAAVPGVIFSPLRNGVKTFVMRRFDLEPYLHAAERHQITDCGTVPPMVISIIT